MSYEINPRAARMRDELAEDIDFFMGRDCKEGYYSRLDERLSALSNQRMPSAELHCRAVFEEAQKMFHRAGLELLPIFTPGSTIGYNIFRDDEVVQERSTSYLHQDLPYNEVSREFAVAPSQN